MTLSERQTVRSDDIPAKVQQPSRVLRSGASAEERSVTSGGSDSSALVSDVPTSVDPPSSLGKRHLDEADVTGEMAPPEKKPCLSEDERVATIAAAVSSILDCLDDEPLRQGLLKTPTRYAKALLSLTSGYRKSVKDILGDAEFDENHTEVVLVRNIDIHSLCEHHLLPFHGSCHVAYIPTGPVIGLSKIARMVDMFAKRFQVQERLTTQIADAVQDATSASGVMVYLTCSHMCMAMRGVQKVGSQTITTAARGRYVTDPDLRRDFFCTTGPPHPRQ